MINKFMIKIRCDLYADKFISMPLNLRWKPSGY